MFQPKIIFFDIDDTLYDTHAKRIPDATQKAMKLLNQKGIITAIATGRSIAVLPDVIRNLIQECGIDMIVSINGQYVQYRGEKLVSFAMEKDDIRRISQIFQENQISYAYASHQGVFVAQTDTAFENAVGSLNLPFEIQADFYEHHEVYQMLGFYAREHDEMIQAQLPNNIRTVRWHETGVDLLEKQGSKARGIQAAVQKLGFTIADAMAFGDGANDIEMLKHVGFGVAMGNAVPELKQVAQYIAPNIDEDGIYRALVDLGVIN